MGKPELKVEKVPRMEPIHYAQRGGEFCPYCRTASVVAASEPLGARRGRIVSPMRCTECKAHWADVHILIGYLPDLVGVDSE